MSQAQQPPAPVQNNNDSIINNNNANKSLDEVVPKLFGDLESFWVDAQKLSKPEILEKLKVFITQFKYFVDLSLYLSQAVESSEKEIENKNKEIRSLKEENQKLVKQLTTPPKPEKVPQKKLTLQDVNISFFFSLFHHQQLLINQKSLKQN